MDWPKRQTFFGDPKSMPKIVFDRTAAKYGTVDSATVAVESDYFVAINIEFVNSASMPDAKRDDQQAVALRISEDKTAFHNCKFIGYQDTLCDFVGRHIFRDCYIEGPVDFIFGDGQSLYLNSNIKSVAIGLSVITVHGRQEVSGSSGFAFVHCKIIGSGDTYLGRAWKKSPRVIFAFTFTGEHINDQGWLNGMYGESNNNQNCNYAERSVIATVIDWQRLKTVKEVRSFFRLAGYYRSFVDDFAKLAKPLMTLTKKEMLLQWTLLEDGVEFDVYIDASHSEIGVVLIQ
ncbi:putative pectinesterase 63 [Mangifera indica]|uniref:putative pectinesterase 63 n=1 Tax=Mangifera indica TaxID=29780 RepID=UPI001CF991CE|nr:putative pectinesterase 63 [Mangifera indica]